MSGWLMLRDAKPRAGVMVEVRLVGADGRLGGKRRGWLKHDGPRRYLLWVLRPNRGLGRVETTSANSEDRWRPIPAPKPVSEVRP